MLPANPSVLGFNPGDKIDLDLYSFQRIAQALLMDR
jgi:hypothetical protein